MWEETTCLRFRENMQAQDAIRYVLEKGDSCFTEYIGRNGGFQDIIIGSECAEEYVVAHETGHALGFWYVDFQLHRVVSTTCRSQLPA